jgi:DNA-binding MarR family transcriptional regulator
MPNETVALIEGRKRHVKAPGIGVIEHRSTRDAWDHALAIGQKYVNIADIKRSGLVAPTGVWILTDALHQKTTSQPKAANAMGPRGGWRRSPSPPEAGTELPARGKEDGEVLDLVELFFFAYRDFVRDADRLLETYGFGRAHHRVLHFVDRRPGLSIAALLDILRITKQSLNRVLKQLLDAGLVEARAGANDRRQRLLFLTSSGQALARELAALQSERCKRVLGDMPIPARGAAADFLFAMIDGDERARVRDHLARARNNAQRAGETP